jgi:MSHA biogenesis protein MshP
MHPEYQRHISRGFVLPAAIFLLVIMAGLSLFLVQVTTASMVDGTQDMQGARASQAARLGIETGLYAVQVNGNCPGGTLSAIAGLSGFKITWACSVSAPFNDAGTSHTIYQITSTACTTSGASCPSTTTSELSSSDYVERQLVVVTEK